MTLASQPVGRRERNKQDKLERITAAASELFAVHGVDEVYLLRISQLRIRIRTDKDACGRHRFKNGDHA